MRNHLAKARYSLIAILTVAAVVLFARTFTAQSRARAAMVLVPTSAELAVALHRAGLKPETLAAAGVSPGAASAVVAGAMEDMEGISVALSLAQEALAQARQQRDQFTRLVQSGQASPEQLNACASAATQMTQCETQLQGTLLAFFAGAAGSLSNAQRGKLATMRSNGRWELPTEFLVVNRTEAQWVDLRNCLANERIAASLGEPTSPEAAAALAAFRSHPHVASAKASLDANLAAVTAAWNEALEGQ